MPTPLSSWTPTMGKSKKSPTWRHGCVVCCRGKIVGTYEGWYQIGLVVPFLKWSEQIFEYFDGFHGFPSTPVFFIAINQSSNWSLFRAGNLKNRTISESFLKFRKQLGTQQYDIWIEFFFNYLFNNWCHDLIWTRGPTVFNGTTTAARSTHGDTGPIATIGLKQVISFNSL